MNLVEHLCRVAAAHPERPALTFVRPGGDRQVRFGQLDRWSARIAGGLLAQGIGEGARVVVLAPLSPELYAGLVALWRLGAVAVFLDPWSGRASLEQAASTARADALVAGRAAAALRLLSPALRRIPLVLSPCGSGSRSLARLSATGPVHDALADVDREHPALVTFSSGSAARGGGVHAGPLAAPRVVIRSHGLLEAQHLAIARALPQAADDVDLTTFPVLVLHNLAGGVPTVVLEGRGGRADRTPAAAVRAAMERNGCRTAVAAPAFWQELAEAARAAGRSLPLRRIAVGGAVVGAALLEALGRAAPRAEIVAVYGSSEVEPVATIGAAELLALAPRTAAGAGAPLGLAVPEASVRILDEEGRALPDGRSGEIAVAGGHVAGDTPRASFLDAADQTPEPLGSAVADPAPPRRAADDDRRWHRMGDQGYRDPAGRLWLLGRTHDLPRRAGRVVHPVAVEAAVEGLSFVARAALVGIPFLEQAAGAEDHLVLAVQLGQGDPAPAGWAEAVRQRVARLAPDPAAADDGDGAINPSGAAAPPIILDEVLALERLPLDRRHRSRVDSAALRRRLIDRRRGPHLRAWLAERFPPLQHGLLIASYFGANALLAQAALGRRPLGLGWREAAGALALLGLFFLLRVIDEHKDFAADRWVHPGRVLSRGLVTLGQLRGLGTAALALVIGLSWSLGPEAAVGCLWVLGLTTLIARDFFLGRFLEAHPLLGALIHLAIMPLYSLFIFSAVSGRTPGEAPATVLLYAWVGYAVALAYELARKTRTPGEERPGLVTYSRRMGPYRPAWLALAAIATASLVSWRVGTQLGLGSWYHGLVMGLLALVTWAVLDYRWRPSPARAARLKDVAGLYIIAFDVLLALALAQAYGLGRG
jgi:acyl-CoA synthetase (AMP-forming)/AMP-acid ligase II/4-hydroxybenzoate polyprenyltransferase